MVPLCPPHPSQKERAAMGIASKRDLRGRFGETALYAWR